MATQNGEINFKNVFESHNLDSLESGGFQYITHNNGKKAVMVVSEEWGRKVLSLCRSLKIVPAHGNAAGRQINGADLFIIGGHVRAMNGLELVDPYKFARSEFKDGSEIDTVVLAKFMNALAPLAITAEGAKALRVQYEAGLLDGSIPFPKKDGGSSQEKNDDEVDPEIAARLSGGQQRYAKSLASRQTIPLTYVFAELSDRLRIEWKLCQYWCNEDKKKKAAQAKQEAEGASLRSSIGGLLGNAKTLQMSADFNAKSPRQNEAVAPELMQETAGLLGGKPARKGSARAARPSVDSAV